MLRPVLVALTVVSLLACGGRSEPGREATPHAIDAGADAAIVDAGDASDAAPPFCEPGTRELGAGVYEQCVCQDVTPSDALWLLQLACEHGDERLGGGCHVGDGGAIEDAGGSACGARVGGDAAVLFCVKLTCKRPG